MGAARNDRLREAMTKARLNVDGLAQAAAVDAKTVQRWLAGRPPQRRLRWTVADVLDEEEDYLWPASASAGRSGSTGEIVSVYPQRLDLERDVWRGLIVGARHQIDLLDFDLLFLFEQIPDFAELLRDRASHSCEIRICTPRSTKPPPEPHREGETSRIADTYLRLSPLQDTEHIGLRAHLEPMPCSIFRFDGQMLINLHLHRTAPNLAPLLRVRRLSARGFFGNYERHFDTLWGEASDLYEEDAPLDLDELDAQASELLGDAPTTRD